MTRGRKPKLKAKELKEAGYKYKIEYLIKKEKDEWINGKKVIVNGKEYRGESEDYDYFYKILQDNIEVHIHHVNGDFYYNGVKLKNASQLPTVEKLAVDNHKFAKMDAQVEDTTPLEIKVNTSVPGNVKPITSQFPDSIILQGGPLDGHVKVWSIKLPFYMIQYEGYDNNKKVVLATRYRRDKDNKHLYIHDPSIG